MKQFKVVAIIGPRQCGKTTLAKMLYINNKPGVYFDLESPADMSKFKSPEYFLSSLSHSPIVIDEIQRLPELFALLRSLVDKQSKKGAYLVLGSASPHLIKGVSETLAGRIAYVEVCPLSLIEIYKKNSDINKHWFRGGFPDAWLAKNEKQWFNWMDSFFRTFVERDLNTLFGTYFSTELSFKLWRMLGHFQGCIWNAQSFAKGLNVSAPTVNHYLEHLEGAFIVRKLPAYFHNAKKRLVKSPKVYIRDSGLAHYLCDVNSSTDVMYNPAVGNSWEGYVIEQIVQQLPSGIKPYYYRTSDGSEMDLVLVKGLKPLVCIEIKTTNEPNLSRGFYESLTDLKCKNAYVITPHQQQNYLIEKNIHVVGLLSFLTNILPKLIK